MQWLGEKLGTTQREPDWKAEVEKLLTVEDKLTDCQTQNSELTKQLGEKDAVISEYNTEVTKESGYTVKSPKGVKRAFGSFRSTVLEQADKNPDPNSLSTSMLIKLLVERLKIWKKLKN